MKKIGLILFVLTIVLSSCTGNVSVADPEMDDVNEPTAMIQLTEPPMEEIFTDEMMDESEGITVERNMSDVELTLPAWFFEDQTPEEVFGAVDAEEGVKSVEANEDGSYTFVISKALYEDTLLEFRNGIDETIEDVLNGEDYVSVTDVTHGDDLKIFDVYVDPVAYEEAMFDSIITMVLGMSGMMYQLFSGTPYESIEVVVNIVNQDTGEVIESAVYPQLMDELIEMDEMME